MSEKEEVVEEQMEMTLRAFLEQHDDDIGRGYVDTDKFEGFDQILQDIGIVKTKPMGMINLGEKVGWWKRTFRRYKHK